jgi:hypothetical protein
MSSKHSLDTELFRQNASDLMVQYNELLCLRAELVRLLFPLKISPPRKYKIRPRNRSAAVSRDERPASSAPFLLLLPEPPSNIGPLLARRPKCAFLLVARHSTGWMTSGRLNPAMPSPRHAYSIHGRGAGPQSVLVNACVPLPSRAPRNAQHRNSRICLLGGVGYALA